MIVIGDLHLKEKQPFKNAQIEFLSWLDTNFSNESMIFLGDIFDSSSPKWETYALFEDFLLKRTNQVFLLQGNHSLSSRKGSALNGLHLLKNIEVIFERKEIYIEGNKCLFLPYTFGNFKEEYEQLIGQFDFIFSHVTPWFAPFSEFSGIKFSDELKGNFIHGHIHTRIERNNNLILGVPIITRHGEQNDKFQILEIVPGSKERIFHDVPSLFTYETLEYGQFPSNKNNILNITNVPSWENLYKTYKGYNIREEGVEFIKSNNELQFNNTEFESSDLKKKFSIFALDRTLDKDLSSLCFQYIDKYENLEVEE